MGVVLYILLSGQVPFPGEDAAKIINAVKIGQYTFEHQGFDKVSDSAKQLIQACLNKDPQQRITAEQALAHPWFTQASLSQERPSSSYQSNLRAVISSSMLQPT